VDKQWSKERAVTRLATGGLAAVLLLLTGFALWAAYSTNRAARQADHFNRLSDAYQQARFAVAAEESLERKYRLEPGPEVRQRYQQAAAALAAALDVVCAIAGAGKIRFWKSGLMLTTPATWTRSGGCSLLSMLVTPSRC
jgi:hypothetical protein